MKGGLPFRILIVEDDPDDRYFIDEAFVEIGYAAEIKKFINGEHLIKYLNQIEAQVYPHLIIVDNSLPRMDASQLLSIIKSDHRFDNIRIVVYSTTMSPMHQEKLLNAGAYACYQKPAIRSDIVLLAKQFRQIAEASQDII